MLSEIKWIRDAHMCLLRAVKHRVELSWPLEDKIHYTLYRVGTKALQLDCKESNIWSTRKLAEPGQTEGPSPVLSDLGRLSSCNFVSTTAKLDAIILQNAYLIPQMDEWIGVKWDRTTLILLEAKSRYSKIGIGTGFCNKSAFTWHQKLLWFACMLFELAIAIEELRQPLDATLSTVKQQLALVSIHIIILFPQTLEHNIELDWKVLTLLHITWVTLKVKKRKYFTNNINYAGNEIRSGWLKDQFHITDDDANCNRLSLTSDMNIQWFCCKCFRRLGHDLQWSQCSLQRKLVRVSFTISQLLPPISHSPWQCYQGVECRCLSLCVRAKNEHAKLT